MSRWKKKLLGEIAAGKRQSVDPAKHTGETFDLYSIPAYDEGSPEIVKGSAIGSAKKSLEDNDVLLSRIVPHIRRVWVLGESNGNRRIGSGE